MARTPAIELVPGLFRIPTAPADFLNSFAFLDDDGQVTLVDTGMRTRTTRADWQRSPRRLAHR